MSASYELGKRIAKGGTHTRITGFLENQDGLNLDRRTKPEYSRRQSLTYTDGEGQQRAKNRVPPIRGSLCRRRQTQKLG